MWGMMHFVHRRLRCVTNQAAAQFVELSCRFQCCGLNSLHAQGNIQIPTFSLRQTMFKSPGGVERVSNSVTRLSLCCYVDTTNSAQAATVLASNIGIRRQI